MIRIEVPGPAVAQGRPRATAALGHVRLYDPPKSRAYKQTVAIYARQAMGQRLPTKRAVACHLWIYRPIQQSESKHRRDLKASGFIRPAVKPDVDNVFKSVTDACTGIVWHDDNQIVEAHIVKQYSDRPRVVLEVEEFEEE
ncbi:RusA family crossover junction endodeoxyribonuclease [Schleiferilactobacillus harbinensis]|uniref:RusA family crossover junction endodeoxyribonuclease n=1 Tax=Schleiferilactobacillus harbinensis TaxID=304207 RepID=UPI001239B3FA|nr:RusA family crossover junction endodeoxyribonuclease [Schleiferilactobacillus harbinensis]QEU46188.1 RusA family crossover junction endodeoxyribonuclease [Schleiferilactobacillus harbinensis]